MAYPYAAGHPTMSGNYIPEIWSGKLLEKFYASTVLAAISNTEYEGEIKNVGDVVHIRTIPDISINDYVLGQNLRYERLAGTILDLKIDQGKYWGFPIDDVEEKQADIKYMTKWAEDAAQQMKISIERSVFSTAYTSAYATNKGTQAGAISGSVNLGTSGSPVAVTKLNVVDFIVDCGLVLDEQNVPESDRFVVLPAWACARIKTSELKDASMTGDGRSTLRNGRVGMIDRFTIYSSNLLPNATDGSYLGFHALAGHKYALAFASQLTKQETLRNPDDFGDIMRGLNIYGWKVIKPEAFCDLYIRAA